MMLARSTASPVTESTVFMLIRLPVAELIWLSRMRSASVVAGVRKIGQATSDRRKWPDQVGRGIELSQGRNPGYSAIDSGFCRVVGIAGLADGKLATYRAKRDFSRTAEPRGEATVASDGQLRYVIQKHAATRLHYDLRLEL